MRMLPFRKVDYYLSDRSLLIIGTLFSIVICLGIISRIPFLGAVLPVLFITSYLLCYKLTWIYRLLFILIPLSIEFELPGGLGVDVPGEPILWILTIVACILIIFKGIPAQTHNWISIMLVIHLGWIFFTCVFAIHPLISIKYALAKIWYIIPFYFLPFFLLKNKHDIRVILKMFIVGTFIGGCYFFFHHLQSDLSYLSRTNAGLPIWRNHVNYACTLVLNLPIIWYLNRSSKHPDKWLYYILFFLLLVFIYFSYTRISYLAMLAVLGYYFILKFKWTKWAILISFISVIISIVLLEKENRYIHLAPQFDKTITQTNFEGKITSITQGEDISAMERVHRWVAGGRMIAERPWVGFGPGNFYSGYKTYTIYSFETYVSDNPERSGIHNNYLMVIVEQGVIGLILFLSLIIIALLKIENSFHTIKSIEGRRLIMMLGFIFIMILVIITVNDMIETIKLGSIFFLVLSLINAPCCRSSKSPEAAKFQLQK